MRSAGPPDSPATGRAGTLAPVIEPSESTALPGATGRLRGALGRRSNWEQLAKFCVVGASGYFVNLAVYVLLFKWAGIHYLPAAVGSFLVAVANNYTLNRVWTFREHQGSVAYQGPRFLVVSTCALGANLLVLYALVEAGAGAIPAQAVAIVVVTPLNFIGNKLWSFRR
jgi:putative flippase GtrA